ncbi:hypothetical protein [Gloeomargarita sp.]
MNEQFKRDLNFSQSPENEPLWASFYQRLFGEDLIGTVRLDGSNNVWQKSGADRLAVVGCGRCYTIDEKLRRSDWDDILLEYASVARRTGDTWEIVKPGWATDSTKSVDFIAYALPKRQAVYVLPFLFLRLAVQKNFDKWRKDRRVKLIEAVNSSYVSLSLAVPVDMLMKAISEQMVHTLGVLETPPAKAILSGQLAMDWGLENLA